MTGTQTSKGDCSRIHTFGENERTSCKHYKTEDLEWFLSMYGELIESHYNDHCEYPETAVIRSAKIICNIMLQTCMSLHLSMFHKASVLLQIPNFLWRGEARHITG